MEEIAHLPNDALVVGTIAEWHQQTWGYLTGRSTAERIAEFEEQFESRRIPLTLVAFVEGRPVGNASLLQSDMTTHPELTPWLASVFVLPHCRRRGIGARLCGRAVAEAERLGVTTLYLFTADRAPFYRRMGWVEMLREHYGGEPVTIMQLPLSR